MLLDYGAGVQAGNELGQTPLLLAAAYDNAAVGRLLLAHDAAIEAADRSGFMPLMMAAAHVGATRPINTTSTSEILATLPVPVDHGANVNTVDALGYATDHRRR